MTTLFETLESYFEKEGWVTRKPPEAGTVLAMAYRGENGTWPCVAQVDEATRVFAFYSISPVACPEEKRTAMAEFLNQANYGFSFGAFEMDVSDGEIRFRVGMSCKRFELTQEIINDAIEYNLGLFDHGLIGIFGIIHGGMSPAEAIEQVEGNPPASGAGGPAEVGGEEANH